MLHYSRITDHVVWFIRLSSSALAYCKLAKKGAREGLAMRLCYKENNINHTQANNMPRFKMVTYSTVSGVPHIVTCLSPATSDPSVCKEQTACLTLLGLAWVTSFCSADHSTQSMCTAKCHCLLSVNQAAYHIHKLVTYSPENTPKVMNVAPHKEVASENTPNWHKSV